MVSDEGTSVSEKNCPFMKHELVLSNFTPFSSHYLLNTLLASICAVGQRPERQKKKLIPTLFTPIMSTELK